MLDYRLTYDGRVVHSLGVGIACVEATCDLEAGSPGTLSFTIDPTHPMAREEFAVKDARREVVLEDRGVEMFRGRVTEVEGDAGAMRTVTCEGQLAYLGDSMVRDYATVDSDDLPDGAALVSRDVVGWLVDQHNLRVGPEKAFAVGTDGGAWADVRTTDGPSTLDEINRRFCDGQDRYLLARYEHGERLLDVLDGGQGTGTQTIVFGENLMDFASSRSWDDIVTAIVATGTADRESEEPVDAGTVDGEVVRNPAADSEAATRYQSGGTGFGAESIGDGTYTVNDVMVTVEGDRIVGDELAARYGIFEVRRSYDAKTPNQLLNMAAADLDPLASNIRELESVDVTAFDLSATNPSLEPIALLDWERIFAPPYGVDQWMPCSKMHVDICRPDSTNFHFGDVPATLTRRSALRMGLIQRGTGELIRRADGAARDADLLRRETNRNSDRIDDAVDKAERDLEDATDRWGEHLDEETRKWYESLSDAEKEAAQGREELQRNLDELGGTLDGVQELADSARRTFYGVCSTGGSDPYKVVLSQYLTQPGGQTFRLEEGVVVEVLFQHEDSTGAPTLNIAGSGPHPIYCYGTNQGVWRKDTVMRFVYAQGIWQCTNAPLYGSPLIVGNPAQGNMYSNGLNLDMRIGETSYWHVDASGQRVGLVNGSHIQIGDSSVSFGDYGRTNLEVGYDDANRTGLIYGDNGVAVKSGKSPVLLKNEYCGVLLSGTSGRGVSLTHSFAGSYMSFDVGSKTYRTCARDWIMCSVLVNGTGNDWIGMSASTLGVSDLTGYFLDATNGDYNAREFFVLGCEIVAGSLYVKFDRTVSGTVRLNFLGIPVGTVPGKVEDSSGGDIMTGHDAGDPTDQEGAD